MILESEKEFFEFIYKRQLIWYKRFVLNEKAPWSEDRILKTFKIINVYRELDRCTLYIINKLKNLQNRDYLFLNIVFFRFFNKNNLYESLEINPFEKIDKNLKEKINQKFSELKKQGKPIFNNAYLISSGKKGKEKHISIIENLSKINLKEMVEKIDKTKTPEESFEVIKEIPMVGPFLACEIWTDLTYLNFFKQKWNDNDFVNIGPGAKWGLEIIYEKRLNKKEQKEKLNRLYDLQKEILPELNKKPLWKELAYKNAFSNHPFLSITNIEGALCEFRKYKNLSQGKGKKRYFFQNTP
ncbi:MAG: nucleotide kinase domain-containing protein [Candidatus Pacearchaeota archaeon]